MRLRRYRVTIADAEYPQIATTKTFFTQRGALWWEREFMRQANGLGHRKLVMRSRGLRAVHGEG